MGCHDVLIKMNSLWIKAGKRSETRQTFFDLNAFSGRQEGVKQEKTEISKWVDRFRPSKGSVLRLKDEGKQLEPIVRQFLGPFFTFPLNHYIACAFDFFSIRGAESAEGFPEWNTDDVEDADDDGFYRYEFCEVEVKGFPFSASKYPVDQVDPVEGCFLDWINKICGTGLLHQGGIGGEGKNLAEAQRAQRDFIDGYYGSSEPLGMLKCKGRPFFMSHGYIVAQASSL